jgi:hypothetical protein
MAETQQPTESVAQETDKAPRSLWETVLTSTPVILTIVATFLAGQSSGEMTRAQYHRALASQNQSKVGDQWAFFQAKRMRGTSYEMTAELLDTLRDVSPFQRDSLPTAAQQMARELKPAVAQSERLREAVAAVRGANGNDSLGQLEARAVRLAEVSRTVAGRAEKESVRIASLLNPPAARPDGGSDTPAKGKEGQLSAQDLDAAFKALNSSEAEAPPRKEGKAGPPWGLSAEEAKQVEAAIAAIKTREPEKKVLALVAHLRDETLQQAIAAAEKQAEESNRKGKAVENALAVLDALVKGQVVLGRDFVRAARDFRLALAVAEGEVGAVPESVRKAFRAVERSAEVVRALSDDLNNDYTAARLAFTARRYETDARENQVAAYLYDVKVQLSSARSDHHLQRSKNFFYGMLAAQVAVTIATLALAVRQKSLMWGLAACAGVGAILFGVYVFLDLN